MDGDGQEKDRGQTHQTTGIPSQGDFLIRPGGGGKHPALELLEMPKELRQWMVRGNASEEQVKATAGLIQQMWALDGYTDFIAVAKMLWDMNTSKGGQRIEDFLRALAAEAQSRRPLAMGDRFMTSVDGAKEQRG